MNATQRVRFSLAVSMILLPSLVLFAGSCGDGDGQLSFLGLKAEPCETAVEPLFGNVPVRIVARSGERLDALKIVVPPKLSIAAHAGDEEQGRSVVTFPSSRICDGNAKLDAVGMVGGSELRGSIRVCIDNDPPVLRVDKPDAGSTVALETSELVADACVGGSFDHVAVRLTSGSAVLDGSCEERSSGETCDVQICDGAAKGKRFRCTVDPSALSLVSAGNEKIPGKLSVVARDRWGKESQREIAVDLTSRLRWAVDTGSEIRASATIVTGGDVVVGNSAGVLTVIGSDGATKCTVSIPDHPDTPSNAKTQPIATPLISNGTRVFGASQHAVFTFDAANCSTTLKVEYKFQDQTQNAVARSYNGSTPAFDAETNKLYIGAYGLGGAAGVVRALSVGADGTLTEDSEFSLGSGVETRCPLTLHVDKTKTPNVRQVIFGTRPAKVIALSVADSTAMTEVWSASGIFGSAEEVRTRPMIHKENVYVAAGTWIRSFKLADGERFSFNFQSQSILHASPAVLGDHIYATDNTRTLYKVGADSALVKQVKLSSILVGGEPLVHNDVLYVHQNLPGRLNAFDGDLKLLWSIRAGPAKTDEFGASPVANGDTLYIGSTTGKLLAIDVSDAK